MVAQQRSWRPIRRGILFLLSLVIFPLFVMVSPTLSAETRYGETVIIRSDEVVNDDLYIAGETVIIDGLVKGDAVIAARQAMVNGKVEGDLMAAGRSISINGSIGDDARIAGQVLTLGTKAKVTDDMMAAGMSLENQVGSLIGGDLNFGGMQVLLAGAVGKNVRVGVDTLEVSGSVGKNLDATVVGDPNTPKMLGKAKTSIAIPQLQSGLTIKPTAKINGNFRYKSGGAAQISPDAKIAGTITPERLDRESDTNVWSEGFGYIQRFLALLLIGWLLLRFTPNWMQGLVNTIQAQPLASLAWGSLGLIAIVPVAFLLFISLFLVCGVLAFTLPILIPPILGAGILAYIALALVVVVIIGYFTPTIAGLGAGEWLTQKFRPQKSIQKFGQLVIGLLLFTALSIIPVLGWLVNLGVAILGMGGLWLSMTHHGHDHPQPNHNLVIT
jgi:cytoskeletal protein CcmA (bactofilin family)